jgi:cytidylate kinase
MGKESKKGVDFYSSKGLKSLHIYLPANVHRRLTEIARYEDRSMQKAAARILMEYTKKRRVKK